MDDNGLIICISGNIGAGKTTLGKLLAESLGAEFFQEPINVPLLNQFLSDPARYAYAFQLYMLTRRQLNYALALENKKHGKITIVDRSLRCDKVFAELQHTSGSITDDELHVYKQVYDDFVEFKPDVVLHLDANIDTLMSRIQDRARDGESTYTREYLTNLTKEYNTALKQMEANGIKICRLDWNDNTDLTSKTATEDMINLVTGVQGVCGTHKSNMDIIESELWCKKGHFNRDQFNYVSQLAKTHTPKYVLETGFCTGRSAASVLGSVDSVEKFVTIDIDYDYMKPEGREMREKFHSEFAQFVSFEENTNTFLTPAFIQKEFPEGIDWFTVDGDHSYKGATHDLETALPFINAGGIIIVDDYESGPPNGWVLKAVTDACNDFYAKHKDKVERTKWNVQGKGFCVFKIK